jgi:hypothetical protein
VHGRSKNNNESSQIIENLGGEGEIKAQLGRAAAKQRAGEMQLGKRRS